MANGTTKRTAGSLVEVPVLSEQMVRRDNFFHSCWMELKRSRPDLWIEMNNVELCIAGLEAKPAETKDEPDEDANIL